MAEHKGLEAEEVGSAGSASRSCADEKVTIAEPWPVSPKGQCLGSSCAHAVRATAVALAACALVGACIVVLAVEDQPPGKSSSLSLTGLHESLSKLELRQARDKDFFTADQAKADMKNYWKKLDKATLAQDAAGKRDIRKEAHRVQEDIKKSDVFRHEGPMSASQARNDMEGYFQKQLLAVGVKGAIAVAHGGAKGSAETAEQEMERIWSTEAKQRSNKRESKLAKARADIEHGLSRHHQAAATEQLPLCQHCSIKNTRWPIWNHRIDHAMKVAQKIAAGTKYNATLHLGDTSTNSESSGTSAETKQEQKLEVEEAMATLQAAIAQSQADKIEAQVSGEQSLVANDHLQCLSLCYAEVQGLASQMGIVSQDKSEALPGRSKPPTSSNGPDHSSDSESANTVVRTLTGAVDHHQATAVGAAGPVSHDAPSSEDSLEDIALMAAAKAQEEVRAGQKTLRNLKKELAAMKDNRK